MTEYRYDLHVHTSEVSKCGWLPGAFLAERYHQLGYAGFAITDHLYGAFAEKINCGNDWDTYINRYLEGFHRAKTRGDALGLDVLLGAEVRFPGSKSDYLIYGIDESFLRRNPFLYRLGPEVFWERFHNEVLIINAHPYRGGNERVFPSFIHGAEAVNACCRHKNYNEKALDLLRRNPRLLPLAGSDTHRPGDEGKCAVCLKQRAQDSSAIKALLEAREYRLEAHIDRDLIDECNRMLIEEGGNSAHGCNLYRA